MTELQRVGALLSTEFADGSYPASRAIDGNLNTLCGSDVLSSAHDEFLSVEVPAGSRIDYVAIWNRDDYAWATAMLSPFELWLTATPDTVTTESATAALCGTNLQAPGLGPFVFFCPGGHTDLRFITVILRAADAPPVRLLTITELRAYTA